jgi:hypothetical protein
MAIQLVLSTLFSRIVVGRLGECLSNNRVLNRLQAGFVRKKRTVGSSTFVIKTTADEYLRAKQCCSFRCFVELEKAFDW